MDEPPAQALRTKRDSSMRVALDLVAGGEADACVSAGNTGALLAISRFVLKTLPGIDRPAIISALPSRRGHTHVLDLGANVDPTPEHLFQFAVMGSTLVSAIHHNRKPRIGLLNVGEEEIKGHERVREAAQLIARSDLNYIGYVEGDGIFSGEADVVVCDGFAGNIALKSSEGAARMIGAMIRGEFRRTGFNRIAGVLARPVLRTVARRMDPRTYNGAVFVGLQGDGRQEPWTGGRALVRERHPGGGRGGREQCSGPHRGAPRRPSFTGTERMTFARIAGTGGYLPERVLTNDELAATVDTTDEWIRERTGIRERRIAAPGETTCDLAERASRRALEAAGLEGADLDLIVVGTTTPDRVYPSTACRLQARLGGEGGAAFDVQAVCTGFIYALGVAEKFVRTGSAARALVVGADVHSRLLDWSDRGTCILFGDGAGAVVLEGAPEPGVMTTHLHADGTGERLLYVEGSVEDGYDNPTQSAARTRMQGNEVFKRAVRALGGIVDQTLQANGLARGDLDWLVPHQANYRIIEATARRLRMPMERVVVTVDRHGNTSAGSVPLALDEAVRDGRIDRGDLLLLEAFGGGFTWGSALVRF